MNQYANTPKVLWSPSQDFRDSSNLSHFAKWLETEKKLKFSSYAELWDWSVNDIELFWQCISEYFNVIFQSNPHEIVSKDFMPETRWFSGATLNYAEHIFRMKNPGEAIIFKKENGETQFITWKELENKTAAFAAFLRSKGVKSGDRVVGFLPNIPEATIAFLATCSIGAVWSSCSPDFGSGSVIDRFQQISPKVLIAVDGYQYNGKEFNKRAIVDEIRSVLTDLEVFVEINYLNTEPENDGRIQWKDTIKGIHAELSFEPVPFAHPIWVLYSSGTTGKPKAITHSQGGVLLEHLKYVTFHNDVKPGERYFWFTTTGWMMWNFVQATLLAGATIVLYDGSPAYPGMDALWKLAEEFKIAHFGTSAPFIIASMKSGIGPASSFQLSALRSISSTGSPLPPEGFDWIYDHVKSDVWLISMSGGTDVCSAFVGGNPWEPVCEGEIQCRALGCDMHAYDDAGQEVINEVGEMVVVKPMPSMPVYFWNDPDKEKYRESYFEMFPNIWRHGDWLEITERNTLIIKGRSDATLNRHGVRIGTAEIYQSVDKVPEILDSLVVNIEMTNGNHFMPLFVMMADHQELTEAIKMKIAQMLKMDYSPRHIPDEMVVVNEIPYTISGKKMEAPVKKILMGKSIQSAANLGAMRNPDSLLFFQSFYQTRLKDQ